MYSTHSFWIPKGSKIVYDEHNNVIRIDMKYPSGHISFHFGGQYMKVEDFLGKMEDVQIKVMDKIMMYEHKDE